VKVAADSLGVVQMLQYSMQIGVFKTSLLRKLPVPNIRYAIVTMAVRQPAVPRFGDRNPWRSEGTLACSGALASEYSIMNRQVLGSGLG